MKFDTDYEVINQHTRTENAEQREMFEKLLKSNLDFNTSKNDCEQRHFWHAFPAKFPWELPKLFIENLAHINGKVLDPMAGSCTTLIEASLLNRESIGFDIDPLSLIIGKAKFQKFSPILAVDLAHLVLKEAKERFDFHKDTLISELKERFDYMVIGELRAAYHKDLFKNVISVGKGGVPNNADQHSKISVSLARGIIDEIDLETSDLKSSGQTSGKELERITSDFLEEVFGYLNHLRYGKYQFFIGKSIDAFEQYEHLALLSEILKSNKELRATLGDYLIKPDIVIGKYPIEDDEINTKLEIIRTKSFAGLTPLRALNSKKLTLHASISCKWERKK